MCKQNHIVWEILSHGWQHLQAYEGLLFFAPCAPCARSAVSSSRMVFKVVSSKGLPLAASWNFTSRRMSKASYEISTSRLFLEFYDGLIDFQGRVLRYRSIEVSNRFFDFLPFNTKHHLRGVCCIHFYQSTQAKELFDELHWQSWFKALECFITRCHMIIS